MFNECIHNHKILSGECDKELELDISREEKAGLRWKESVKCNKWDYKSGLYIRTSCVIRLSQKQQVERLQLRPEVYR